MPKDKEFYFVTDCIHSDGKSINDMTDQAKRITWRTFLKYVPIEEVMSLFPFYSYHREMYNKDTAELTSGFHIKDDWAVSFHKSVYRGQPCYYIQHSGIEYIFVRLE